MDLRKLAVLLFFLLIFLLTASHIVPFVTLIYTYLAFPLLQTHVLGENDGFDLANLTVSAPEWNETVVPKVIHQVRLGGIAMRPKWEEARQSCIELHPDWEFKIWDDEAGDAFVKENYPEIAEIYLNYPYEIQRSNILRYLVLHHHGGVYMDLDLRCRVALDPFLVVPFLTPPANPTGVNNAFIVAYPQHPFLTYLIEHIPKYNLKWGTPYITNMFSTGCQFWSTMHTIFPEHASLVVLPQEYKLNGHVTNTLFEHLGASSWHQADARMILRLGQLIESVKAYALPIGLFLALFAALATAIVVRRRVGRRRGRSLGLWRRGGAALLSASSSSSSLEGEGRSRSASRSGGGSPILGLGRSRRDSNSSSGSSYGPVDEEKGLLLRELEAQRR